MIAFKMLLFFVLHDGIHMKKLFLMVVFCFISMQAMEENDERSNNDQHKRSYYFEYIIHPTTLLCTGITALGGYCWHDPETRTKVYEWSKQHFEWLQQKVYESPSTACATIGVGIWGLYTYLFYKRKAREEKMAQEALKGNHAILNAKFILLKSDHEALKEAHKTTQVVYGRRIKFLEQKDEDNDDLKEKLRDWLIALKRKFKNIKKTVPGTQSIVIKELKEDNDESDAETIGQGLEGLLERIQRIESLLQCGKNTEHILVPLHVFANLSKRINNLEKISQGEEIPEKSFAPAAQQKHIKVAVVEDKIVEIVKRLDVIEGHGRYLEEVYNNSKSSIEYLGRRCDDNEEGVDDLVYYLKRKAGEDEEEENSKRLTARFSKVIESPRYRGNKEEDSNRLTVRSSTRIVSPLDGRDEQDLANADNLLQEKFSDEKGKERTRSLK